jgi:hypothetical protein
MLIVDAFQEKVKKKQNFKTQTKSKISENSPGTCPYHSAVIRGKDSREKSWHINRVNPELNRATDPSTRILKSFQFRYSTSLSTRRLHAGGKAGTTLRGKYVNYKAQMCKFGCTSGTLSETRRQIGIEQ